MKHVLRPSVYLLLSLLTVTAVVGCKKKKTSSSSSSPKPKTEQPTAADGTGASCQAKLALVEPLPPVKASELKLAGVRMEEVQDGAYKSAQLSFQLERGAARPDKFVYSACSEKNPKNCMQAWSATESDINALLPEGKVKITAWACVSASRLPASGASGFQKVGDDYCGAPAVTYGMQSANRGLEAYTKAQAEIAALEEQATQLAGMLHREVQTEVLQSSRGLSLAQANIRPELVAIANSPREVFAEAVLYLHQDAKQAADYVVNKYGNDQESLKKMQLADEKGNPCVPAVPDEDISNATQVLPLPPTSSSTAGGAGSVNPPASETPANPANQPPAVPPAAQDEFAEAKTDCNRRDQRYRELKQGSAEWDDELKKCFHIADNGVKQEIDVSVDSSEMAAQQAPVTPSNNGGGKKGLSGWDKAGITFMAVGGALSTVGGIAWYKQSKAGKQGGEVATPIKSEKFVEDSDLKSLREEAALKSAEADDLERNLFTKTKAGSQERIDLEERIDQLRSEADSLYERARGDLERKSIISMPEELGKVQQTVNTDNKGGKKSKIAFFAGLAAFALGGIMMGLGLTDAPQDNFVNHPTYRDISQKLDKVLTSIDDKREKLAEIANKK